MLSKSSVDSVELRKAQLKMLTILQEIDRICVKHNISWWICFGTLLGAVRHQGFIPWDDDCDICMLRDDYDHFMQVAPSELGKDFFLQTKTTDPRYPKKLTKVRLNNTLLVGEDETEDAGYHQGIFVDIFVWDFYPSYAKELLPWFQIMPNLRQCRKKYPKGSFKRSLVGILTAIPYTVHSFLESCFSRIWSINYRNRNLPYIGMQMCHNDGLAFAQDDVFPLQRELSFEGMHFPTPHKPEVLLGAEYGSYMELPPVEQRHYHAKKIIV